MTRQQAAALGPADRKLRRLAKGRLRHRKPTETFTYNSDEHRRPVPTRMDAHRDYLDLINPSRDFLFLTTKGHDIDCPERKPSDG